jgi:hypothetical protein
MSIAKSKRKMVESAKNLSGWDQVILEAQRRIKELRFTIKIYRERKARGEPWPGTQSQGQDSGQQHSV